MKARLSLLQDGGSDKSGRMSWWSKTMLRNNPEAVSGKSSFADLKEVAMRGKHRKGKEAGGENLSGQEYADIRLYGKTDGGKLGDSEDV